MKTNRLGQSSQEQTYQVATASEIVSNLLHFAELFGIARDSDFAQRTCAVAFSNAVMLGKSSPDGAGRLKQVLPSTSATVDFSQTVALALASEVSDDDAWVTSLARNLMRHVSEVSGSGTGDDLEQKVIVTISVGLEAGEHHADLTEVISRRVATLGNESRFLACLLMNWARNGFRPFAEPFEEYVLAYYPDLPIERRVFRVEARETLVCAKLLPDPWRLSFWVEQAWRRGRRFVEKHPEVLKQLLIESPQGNREYTLMLYRALVLGANDQSGRVDIERATLAFFARTEGGGCAVEYCAGSQPRKLTRLAFDFAFWMGILSAMPLPDQSLSPIEPS